MNEMYSIVLIDDEPEQLYGLAEFFPFEKEGFLVKGIYEDGLEALSMIKKYGCDAVLTDIRMNEISGLEIARELNKLPEPPVVCIISAYDDFEYAREALRAGVQDYLSKPASMEDISRTLRRIKAKLDEKTHSGSETRTDLVQNALEIMNKDPGKASLKNVADELDINISYLSRLFKEKTGQNFQSTLLDLKMEKAKKLLSGYNSYTNDEIARVLGYQDTQNFCRTFRKTMGISPQAYRKERKSEK